MMRYAGILKFVVAVALLLGSVPFIHYSGEFDVEVTWSICEDKPQDRMVTYDGDTFLIPAGEEVVRRHRFDGGGNRALLWDHCGFGHGGRVSVEGYDQAEFGIGFRHSETSGTWRILGLGPKRRAKVVMELSDSKTPRQ